MKDDEISCLNTYGCNSKDRIEISYRRNQTTYVTDNFCSERCRRLYSGDLKPKGISIKRDDRRLPDKLIVKLGGMIYIYDPWEHKFFQYTKGKGLLDYQKSLYKHKSLDKMIKVTMLKPVHGKESDSNYLKELLKAIKKIEEGIPLEKIHKPKIIR